MKTEDKIGLEEEVIICRNCDTAFKGNFCPNCGQGIKDLNRPFHFVIYDFAGTLFSFDTRFLRSLKYLLISPGKIARHFIEGKRARYMAPFQMYVFVSFVFFFLLSFYTKTTLKPVYEEQLQIAQNGNDPFSSNQPLKADSLGNFSINSLSDFNSRNLYKAKLKIDEKLRTDTTKNKQETKVLLRISKLFSDPNLFFVTAFKYFSWGLFLVMPFFALLLMAFFGRKGYFYTAHLTMSLNLHTFLFLILILGLLVRIIFHSVPGIVSWLFFFTFSVYEFIGIKRMYQSKFVSTFFLAGILNVLYFFIFLLVSGGIITVAFLSF